MRNGIVNRGRHSRTERVTVVGDFLAHIRQEAEWGLANAHTGRDVSCNAKRQLRLIICAVDQFNGIQNGPEIGFATKALKGERD